MKSRIAAHRSRPVWLAILLIAAACSTSNPPTATVAPTKAPTATMKPSETPSPTAEVTEVATASASEIQPTVISFILPAAGQEIGKDADVKKLAADGKLAGGDPTQGEGKYTVLGCIGCHSLTRVAPPTAGTYTRVVEARLKDPANEGKSADEYIAESILRPNEYVVPNYAQGIMPQDFGTRISLQDLQDLIAYLKAAK
jgi:mono/diheme cytochrome c family protein